jgi:pentose-5-phosphate-3-epimerase
VSTGQVPGAETPPFNYRLASVLRQRADVDLAGSLYAVPPDGRHDIARLLVRERLWVHADVFADPAAGVDLGLITELADAGVGPIDVHLLTAEALNALPVICRPGIARITFPFEGAPDIAGTARQVRACGAQAWLAISPATTVTEAAEAARDVDGLLVMLLEPGTQDAADLGLLAKVQTAGSHAPVGADGGIGEHNLTSVLRAGAGYVVIGRGLFTGPAAERNLP